MPERYRQCRIPDDFHPEQKHVDELMRVRDMLDSGEFDPGIIDCRGLNCRGLSCADCIRGVFLSMDTWDRVAKFEVYEQYLRDAGLDFSDYRRKPIQAPGGEEIYIPVNLLSVASSDNIAMFNSGTSGWCSAISCNGIRCFQCIYCNRGNAAAKISAFAAYADALGFTVNRTIPEATISNCPETPTGEQTPVSSGSALIPSMPPEASIEYPQQNDWTRSLAAFNQGFSCWCDNRAGACSAWGGCSTCICSTANAHAVEAFKAWAESNHWDVHRDGIIDSYDIKDVDDITMDYSMTADSFDDNMVLPKIQTGDYLRVRDGMVFNSFTDVRSHWLYQHPITLHN